MELAKYNKVSSTRRHRFFQGTINTYYLDWCIQLDMDSHSDNLEMAQEKIQGFGWDYPSYANPHRRLLDRNFPNRSVILYRKSLQAPA